MKKFLRSSILAIVCTFAFLFLGVGSVSAADSINNTKVSGYAAKYTIAENDYYAIQGNPTDQTLVLKSISNGKYTSSLWGLVKTYKVYTAQVAVVKCSNYDAEANFCLTWDVYSYSTSSEKTMDALKQDGLKLVFNKLKPAEGQTEVNGAKLGTLKSAHGINNTYFVIVQYRLQTGTLYDPDIFRVVFSDGLANINIAATNTQINVASKFPIANIKYFSTTEKLADGFDFDTEYTNSTTGVESTYNPTRAKDTVNAEFIESVDYTREEGKYYYAQATDILGNKTVLDLTEEKQTENNPTVNDNTSVDNVGNTNVGKYILIALVGILVIALVLVIIQKIVDYRKKLY